MIVTEEWRERALCHPRNRPMIGSERLSRKDWTDIWFDEDADEASSICAFCPSRRPCKEAGTEESGVWGGVFNPEKIRNRERIYVVAR